ncbi:MAG: hypothetical protein V1856_03050 [Candidatus Liptonbacteria bacterium]
MSERAIGGEGGNVAIEPTTAPSEQQVRVAGRDDWEVTRTCKCGTPMVYAKEGYYQCPSCRTAIPDGHEI